MIWLLCRKNKKNSLRIIFTHQPWKGSFWDLHIFIGIIVYNWRAFLNGFWTFFNPRNLKQCFYRTIFLSSSLISFWITRRWDAMWWNLWKKSHPKFLHRQGIYPHLNPQWKDQIFKNNPRKVKVFINQWKKIPLIRWEKVYIKVHINPLDKVLMNLWDKAQINIQ